MNMHFAYQGFTQNGDVRCFRFCGIEQHSPTAFFSIEVDLPLLQRSRVPVQDGPMFCLQLLTIASVGGPSSLGKFQAYRVVAEDFRPLLVERERKVAEKARKKAPRQPFRRPSFNSNLCLGAPSKGN